MDHAEVIHRPFSQAREHDIVACTDTLLRPGDVYRGKTRRSFGTRQ